MKGDPRIHALLKDLGELHDSKQSDYRSEKDSFANYAASDEWGIPSWVNAMLRATDKLKRLQTFARTGTLENEGVENSFKDLALCTLIALVLYRQERDATPEKGIITERRCVCGSAGGDDHYPDCPCSDPCPTFPRSPGFINS